MCEITECDANFKTIRQINISLPITQDCVCVCVCVCVCGQWSALRLPGSFNLHANEGNKQRGAAAGGGTVTTQEI